MDRKSFLTLDNLKEQAEAWNDRLIDAKISANQSEFHPPYNLAYAEVDEDRGLFGESVANTPASLNDLAFGQACNRLGVPASWAGNILQCPDELRKLVMDWKLKNDGKDEYLLRMRTAEGRPEPTGRAFLSSQYTRYDNYDFVQAIEQAVEAGGYGVKVWRPEIGDQMRVYLLIDGIDFEALSPSNGDSGDGGGNGGLRPAVYFSNSETGTGRARVVSALYRSWCANGMLIGYKEESAFAVTHRWKTHGRMAFYINEAIASAMHLSEKAALQFLSTTEAKIEPTKISEIVDKWAKKYGIVLDAKEQWSALCQHQVNTQGEITQYDAINWLTSVAGGWPNTDRREEMEIASGQMIYEEVPAKMRMSSEVVR
jgi:hypothetical protein